MEFSLHTSSCLDCRLADLCLPYGLHIDEVMLLDNVVKAKRPIRADEFLYEQGQPCLHIYAVKSGSFRSFITTTEGIEQTIGFYLPGELMGLESLQHGSFSCSAIALETGLVCELPITRLNELCAEIPSLQLQLMRMLSKEIASDHDKIVLLGHRSAKEKMATFLLMLSQRYGALGFSDTEFNLSMRRQDIANFLGLTVETVSRQLAILNKSGVITTKQRGVQINDLNLLKSMVESCAFNHFSSVN